MTSFFIGYIIIVHNKTIMEEDYMKVFFDEIWYIV